VTPRYVALGAVLTMLLISAVTPADAQKRKRPQPAPQQLGASSATNVSAELTKGKLNPSQSKPGDEVTLRLKEDLRSNGEVVLKKGTTITGVVRSVNRGDARSLVAIEWLAPSGSGPAKHELMLAVQSVTQVNPLYASRQESESDWNAATPPASVGNAGGGLPGGTLSSATGTVASATKVSSRSNVALLSMPSVVAADAQTSASVQSNLGVSSEQQLFHTGKGEVVTAGGSKQSIEIFSHLTNDTVLTSKSKNFEISSGAQMQLLVGVRKN
jgi:hypothetical protein